MNIFYLDRCPTQAAIDMCDKHNPKMVVETAQLLATAHRVIDGDAHANERGMYRATHVNHPSAVWVRKSVQHYDWLALHLAALLDEYTARFGKIHATSRLLSALSEPPARLVDNGWEDPPLAMPDDYRGDDAVEAYRAYYSGDKRRFAQWRNGAPVWWVG